MDPGRSVVYPPGITVDGEPLAAGELVFVRAVLVDPRTPARVLGPLEGRQSKAWRSGEAVSLWRVRLADGREAVVDPTMTSAGPIDRQLNRMHLAMLNAVGRTRGGLIAEPGERGSPHPGDACP